MTKEIPVEAQVPSPAASQTSQTAPVRSAMDTNHSPRMNCFGGTPLVMSM